MWPHWIRSSYITYFFVICEIASLPEVLCPDVNYLSKLMSIICHLFQTKHLTHCNFQIISDIALITFVSRSHYKTR